MALLDVAYSDYFKSPELGNQTVVDRTGIQDFQIPRAKLMSCREFLFKYHNLPAQTAGLGICDDNRPLLFDLAKPDAGPLLVVGDHECGKTRLLQFMVRTAIAWNNPAEVKYLVISTKPEEWDTSSLGGSPEYCAGLFGDYEDMATRMINRMAFLVEQRLSGRQNGPAILLMIDDLLGVEQMDFEARLNLEWLLHHGPAMQVWPIVTLPAQKALALEPWLNQFTHLVTGWMSKASQEIVGVDEKLGADSLVPTRQFAAWCNRSWLRFWLPTRE